jgi:tellurite resistance protein
MTMARYSSEICLTSWRQNAAENLWQEEGLITAFEQKSNKQSQNLIFSEFITYLTFGRI